MEARKSVTWCLEYDPHFFTIPKLMPLGGDDINALQRAKPGWTLSGSLDLDSGEVVDGLRLAPEEFFTRVGVGLHIPRGGKLKNLRKVSTQRLEQIQQEQKRHRQIIDDLDREMRTLLMTTFNEGNPLSVEEARELAHDAGRVIVPPPPGNNSALKRGGRRSTR